MQNIPLVSIIVPCYKVEQYLPGCIDSIINQTYNNLEILLVDDGSPDSTGQICDEFAARDSRVRVIHKNNGGVSDARNVALDVIKGEYVACVDGDDRICPDYIETMYSLLSKYKCQMVLANYSLDYEGDCEIEKRNTNIELLMSPSEAIDDLFYQNHFDDFPWCKLYHRSLFEGIRYPKGIIFEDTYVTYQLMLRCHKIAYTDKQVYKYLIRRDSYEGAPFSKMKMDSAIKVFEKLEYELKHTLKDHHKSVSCRILALSCHLLMKCPEGYDQTFLWNQVKKYRKTVIMDNKARKQARLAALISFVGISMMRLCFKLVDKRK